jgi:hypothetical protein
MNHRQELPDSWFAESVWVSEKKSFHWQESAHLVRSRIKGIPALFTPEGALHVGLITPPNWNALEQSKSPCIIVDLPPGMPFEGRKFWKVQKRHTRQLRWNRTDADPIAILPSHRLKQLRRASRNQLEVLFVSEPKRILALHMAARMRKEVRANEKVLLQQLSSILQSPNQTSCIVQNHAGKDIASAVFLHEKGRTIYAFGGQIRSKESALATVMLIAEGIKSAKEVGNTCFDFGGSMDPGVDKFYAEFGADTVPKLRCVRIAWWAKPWLRITRPDLF